jgi:hypothetical protein
VCSIYRYFLIFEVVLPISGCLFFVSGVDNARAKSFPPVYLVCLGVSVQCSVHNSMKKKQKRSREDETFDLMAEAASRGFLNKSALYVPLKVRIAGGHLSDLELLELLWHTCCYMFYTFVVLLCMRQRRKYLSAQCF